MALSCLRPPPPRHLTPNLPSKSLHQQAPKKTMCVPGALNDCSRSGHARPPPIQQRWWGKLPNRCWASEAQSELADGPKWHEKTLEKKHTQRWQVVKKNTQRWRFFWGPFFWIRLYIHYIRIILVRSSEI